jgi:hypothetical protein
MMSRSPAIHSFKLAAFRWPWLLLICVVAARSIASVPPAPTGAMTTFRMTDDPHYATARTMLRRYAQRHHGPPGQLCALPQVDANGERFVWVSWPARAQLFLWEGQDLGEFEPFASLICTMMSSTATATQTVAPIV